MSEKSWWNAYLERKHGAGLVALTTEVEELSHCHVISASGKLTIDSSPELLERIRESLKRTTCLKLDLKGVHYIDSSGIATLIRGLKLAQEQSAGYVLVDPSPKVLAVIELSQLQDFFVIEPSTEASVPQP
ncbi:MAG: STAS domain-containing protein [Thermoanaerobaculia bacterium]|nr:STAS domain-containing protein [Thermoanaerobaculia bacterium]